MFFVILFDGNGRPSLATRIVFKTMEEAAAYAASIHPDYYPVVVQKV